MNKPSINMIYVTTTRSGQFVKIGDMVNTDKHKNCNEVHIVSSGETIFAGYAVSWSGVKCGKCFDVPVNLYYSDDKTHIIGFQTATLNEDGKTYSFMA